MQNEIYEGEFLSFIQGALSLSCDDSFQIAEQYCRGNYIDDTNCEWYHSAWQYLRLLDKVSSPTWHFSFYYEQFKLLLKNQCKILISGTADYTLLALIYFVGKKENITPQIWVHDICITPLIICQKFAQLHGIELSIIQGDIRSIDKSIEFDIISTDAFLTRFDTSQKEVILRKWIHLLADKGHIVTTVRIEPGYEHDSRVTTFDAKMTYGHEVELLANQSPMKARTALIRTLAENYICKIVSYPFTSHLEMKHMFSSLGLSIDASEHAIVKGEVRKTLYYRLRLTKSTELI